MLGLVCHKGPIVHIIYSYNTLFNLDAALLPPAGHLREHQTCLQANFYDSIFFTTDVTRGINIRVRYFKSIFNK